MTTRTTFLFAPCIASLVGLLAAIAVLGGPANANKDPVTPQQLKSYEDAFMEQCKKGDVLFHDHAATAKQMNVVLTNTAMACANCHRFASDTHAQPIPTGGPPRSRIILRAKNVATTPKGAVRHLGLRERRGRHDRNVTWQVHRYRPRSAGRLACRPNLALLGDVLAHRHAVDRRGTVR